MVNTLVCFLVYKYKSMRNFTNRFVVSLAVSDILTGIVILCQYLIGFKNRIVINIAYAIVMLSGVTNLCAVTYDRYIAVTQPLRYLNIMQKHCHKLLVGVWVISLAVSTLPVIWEGKGEKSGHKIYVILVQILFIGIPFIFIILSHCRIYYHAKKCSGKSRRLSNGYVINSRRTATEVNSWILTMNPFDHARESSGALRRSEPAPKSTTEEKARRITKEGKA
ncbi:hypothetical protein QZH41_007170 [Actinostola sp. cb2023]|nr:hypothetical protein QZH41_007170 [Actinostola sp. cb2023]